MSEKQKASAEDMAEIMATLQQSVDEKLVGKAFIDGLAAGVAVEQNRHRPTGIEEGWTVNRLKELPVRTLSQIICRAFHDNNGKPVECWKRRTRWDDISRVALIVIGAAIAGHF